MYLSKVGVYCSIYNNHVVPKIGNYYLQMSHLLIFYPIFYQVLFLDAFSKDILFIMLENINFRMMKNILTEPMKKLSEIFFFHL